MCVKSTQDDAYISTITLGCVEDNALKMLHKSAQLHPDAVLSSDHGSRH